LGSSREDLGGSDLCVDAEPRGTNSGEELRNDSSLEHPCGEQAVRPTGLDPIGQNAVHENARDVGHEHDSVGIEADREGTRGFVRVHVQWADGDRSDDRYASRSERFLDRRRPTRERLAHQAEVGKRFCLKADLVPDERERRGAEDGGRFGPDGNQRLAHDGEGRCGCDTTTAHEFNPEPAPPELGSDLRSRAVDDHDLVACSDEVEGSTGRGGGDASAELHHNARHVVYSAFSRT
jgi:hypothetical protein